jgi:hypothetical protein
VYTRPWVSNPCTAKRKKKKGTIPELSTEAPNVVVVVKSLT